MRANFTSAQAVLAESTPYCSIHLPTYLGNKLLKARGWIIERVNHNGYAYVVPGGTLRQDGGQFGTDYLWSRDEALNWALTAEALEERG